MSADFKDLREICNLQKNKSFNGNWENRTKQNEINMRKFLENLFRKDINIGEKLNYTNLDARRPNKGIPAEKIELLLETAKIKIKKHY